MCAFSCVFWIPPPKQLNALLRATGKPCERAAANVPLRHQALSYWAVSDVFEESFFPVANESFHGMSGPGWRCWASLGGGAGSRASSSLPNSNKTSHNEPP